MVNEYLLFLLKKLTHEKITIVYTIDYTFELW